MRVILPVGNIGSGKSTFIINHMKNNIVISLDGFRYMIGGGKYRFDKELEPLLYGTHMHMIFEMMKYKKNIIIDETHMTKEGRARHIHTAKLNGYKVHCWVFPRLAMKEAVDRRMDNPHDCPSRRVWEDVWDRNDSQYEEPSLDEGFDHILHITKEQVGAKYTI